MTDPTKSLAREAHSVVAAASSRTALENKLARALFYAIDIVKAHIGGFVNWPIELKDAFSEAIIDTSPLTEEEIRWARELAHRYGWQRSNGDPAQALIEPSSAGAVARTEGIVTGGSTREQDSSSSASGLPPSVEALHQVLRDLIETWRERQRIAFPEFEGGGQGRCADELEAALPAVGGPPRHDEKTVTKE